MSDRSIIDLDASSSSDSMPRRRVGGGGGGKRVIITESSSDSSDSMPRRRMGGGGKRPKIVESNSDSSDSSDDERDDYELRPHSNRVSFKPGTFNKRRTTKDLHYSSDDASAQPVRDESTAHVASNFQEKLIIYRDAFPVLYESLDANSYKRSLVEIEKIPNSIVIQTFEIFKVAEVCQGLGIKFMPLEVDYEAKTCFGLTFDYSSITTCPEELKEIISAYRSDLKDVFTDNPEEAQLGIVVTRPYVRHAMVMFKEGGKFVLVDSNRIHRMENDRYSDMVNGVLTVLSHKFGYSTEMEIRSTEIQRFQRQSREWQLSAYGLCHAFSTMTAVLLARRDLNFSEVLMLLTEPHFETVTYTATVFMCSCVDHFLGSKWFLLKKMAYGEGGGGGGSRQHPNSLTGLTNVIDFYDKEYDNQQAVAFCIYKGHCEPFLPTLLHNQNKDIFTAERWKVLEREHGGIKDLGKRTRVSTIAQLLPVYTEGKQYTVTVRYGHKANSRKFWVPFENSTQRVNSNDDPFRRMQAAGWGNCIEILSYNEVLQQDTGFGYRTDDVSRHSNADILVSLLMGIMHNHRYNRKMSGGVYNIMVQKSQNYSVKFSKRVIDESIVKIGSCEITVQKKTKTSRTFASDVIPAFVSQFLMHKWKPAITIYLLKERRFNARQIMLLLL